MSMNVITARQGSGSPANNNHAEDHANTKSLLARAGVHTLNQKDLQFELKRIDMARRQCEHAYKAERSRIITRFSNKLNRLNSFIEPERIKNSEPMRSSRDYSARGSVPAIVLNDEDANDDSNESYSDLPSPGSHSESPIKRFGSVTEIMSPKTERSSLPRESISFNAVKPILVKQSSMIRNPAESSPQATIESSPSLLPSVTSQASTTEIGEAKVRKNVKWTPSVTEKEYEKNVLAKINRTKRLSREDLFSNSLNFEESDEDFGNEAYRDRDTDLILPDLLVTDRLRNEYQNRRKSMMSVNQQKKRANMDIKTFLSTLDREDSGFFSYRQANGQPVCGGYDNFLSLSKTTTNKPVDYYNPLYETPVASEVKASSSRKNPPPSYTKSSSSTQLKKIDPDALFSLKIASIEEQGPAKSKHIGFGALPNAQAATAKKLPVLDRSKSMMSLKGNDAKSKLSESKPSMTQLPISSRPVVVSPVKARPVLVSPVSMSLDSDEERVLQDINKLKSARSLTFKPLVTY